MAAVLARCLQASPTLTQPGGDADADAAMLPDAAALLRALLALRCNAFAVTDDWAPASWAGATRDQARPYSLSTADVFSGFWFLVSALT